MKRSTKRGLAAWNWTQRPSLQRYWRTQPSERRGGRCAGSCTRRAREPIAVKVASNSGASMRCPRPSRSRAFSAIAIETAARNAP